MSKYGEQLLFMKPKFSYMNVYKQEDELLYGSLIFPTITDCESYRSSRDFFCVAKVQLLEEGESEL